MVRHAAAAIATLAASARLVLLPALRSALARVASVRSAPRPSAVSTALPPLLPAALLAALLLPALLPAAARADEVTSYSYDVEETFTITLDAQGNARFKDVLKYDADFFNTNGFDFEQYPFLLSRRYKARAAVDEIQDFKADLDRQNATVTLTFAQRGKAYNMGDHWTVYGFYAKPTFAAEGKQVFQEESTVNSEYTLWQDLEFKTTTVVKLPPGATNARWDDGDSALTYTLAYTAPVQGNVVQNNQALFIPLFAVLAAGSLVVGAVALVSARRKPAVAPVARGEAAREPDPAPASTPPVMAQSAAGFGFSPATAGPSAVATTPSSGSTTGPSAAGGGEPAGAGGEAPAHFCRHCGAPLDHPDCHFCPSCGGRLSDD